MQKNSLCGPERETARVDSATELLDAVRRFVVSATQLGKRAELEARLGTWDVSGNFRPGVHLRTMGAVQRTLDSFSGWDGLTGWIRSRDVYYLTDATDANRGNGRSVRCELVAGTETDAASVRNTWKRKLGKFDADVRVPALGAGLSADEATQTPLDQVPDVDGTCLSAYGVRFSLAAEEPVDPPPARTESRVTLVRYKSRRSWLWGPFRYDLTLVWTADSKETRAEYGNWTASERAETQLASGVPSSIELEVEFDPNHVSCETLFENDVDAMATAFVEQVGTLVHRDARLYARADNPASR